ncbi:MAG: 3-phosphoglycerate dehydrogenase [Xanthomonadales bacterium]|nr:3-phosphoglycerate dehydrogenase [Xanthomonadales bacterium]
MFRIKTINNISRSGLDRFPDDRYSVSDGESNPNAIILRSANLHDLQPGEALEAIGRAGAGTNNVPVSRMSEIGLPVFNAPGANANAVKELVLTGMLLAARNVSDALGFVGTLGGVEDPAKAMEAEKKRFVGYELEGKTLGVIGLGAIGVRVANAARALGMTVVGFDPHMTVEGAWQLSSDVAKAGSLNELFATADFISFHVPLNDATRGLFGNDALAVAKQGVVLLNFARDGIVDHAALAEGLAGGGIGRYVTDFPPTKLLDNPRVIAMPHLGASTREAEENCARMVVDQIRDFLENGNIRHSVNFPDTRMAREGSTRLCIANRNRPNMIGQLSQVLGAAGINIHQMHNASRGELAYTLIDTDSDVDADALAALRAIDGVLRLRIV